MAANTMRRARHKKMSEINVVPYIDVMLVLLIIFMVTAPLLTQGVQVDLPQASANPVDVPDNLEPLIVSVDALGQFYVSVGDTPDEPRATGEIASIVGAVLRRNPETPVMVRGDSQASYGQVVNLMAALQQAGVPNVGLLTKQPEQAAP